MIKAAGVEAASHQFFSMISDRKFAHLQQTYNIQLDSPTFGDGGSRYHVIRINRSKCKQKNCPDRV
jgi:hypothetical protein